jgi:hypothetical protein
MESATVSRFVMGSLRQIGVEALKRAAGCVLFPDAFNMG